jgi:VIT family/DDE superfamily endonuclease
MAVASRERHRIGRIGWLRAAVLGANDGILSTASLMLGVATSHATHANVLVAGVAGLVAGAMSMAAGFLDSLQSQIAVEYLPPYAPELNPVEYLWGYLEASSIAQCLPKRSLGPL